MFLQLAHTKTPVYHQARKFVFQCYQLSRTFPPEERFAITQQIRRAAVSVYLNIAEGCSRQSAAERRRYFEIARGSVVEVDAALDIASDLGYCRVADLSELGEATIGCFRQLSALINT